MQREFRLAKAHIVSRLFGFPSCWDGPSLNGLRSSLQRRGLHLVLRRRALLHVRSDLKLGRNLRLLREDGAEHYDFVSFLEPVHNIYYAKIGWPGLHETHLVSLR